MSGLFQFSAQPGRRISIRLAGALVLAVGLAWLALMIGCGTPRDRYHTLSLFFDGVPNPDAPVKGRTLNSNAPHAAGVRIVSQHKPYVDNQCAACHASASGDIQDFALAYDACIKCHKKVPTEQILMHGPVARAQCKWCHAPHESTEPWLLKDTPINVCTQCHDKQLLSSNPPEHNDGKTSCLQCHNGHGGAHRYFLKALATQPATQPAATAPANAPDPIPPPGKDRVP